MQLSFPNGEHPNLPLQGEVTIGSRGSRVQLSGLGLAPLHASFVADRRGLWLRVPAGVPVVHVNARPVRRLAQLRPGDLVCLDRLRVLVRDDDDPPIERRIPAAAPAPMSEAQRVSAARVVLRGQSGPHFGRSLTLSEPRLIGRSAAADLRLDDPAVAERHAVVELHGDRIVLRSQCAEPTLVNGVPVLDAVLAPGDQLQVDQYRFVLEAPGLPQRGQAGAARIAANPHTQTVPAVRVPVARDPVPGEPSGEAPKEAGGGRDPGALWWLIAAATVLAAALTALLVYAPRVG
ncbi:FHA domain-containing protein [Arenimonas fontis]|uniref:FHA domain-containing protein n=1 Tax=Arenimonas fontis TaxID=2608255 RepID=A0A5B2ZFL6_9GAMM|nr:FHA domain-containing protein [Arenimonas fontis]KAA2285994.1 FHA domain-containing protein [Arenimonas fontis]